MASEAAALADQISNKSIRDRIAAAQNKRRQSPSIAAAGFFPKDFFYNKTGPNGLGIHKQNSGEMQVRPVVNQAMNNVIFSIESLPDYNGGSQLTVQTSSLKQPPQHIIHQQRLPSQQEIRGVTSSHITHKLKNLSTMPSSRSNRARGPHVAIDGSFETL